MVPQWLLERLAEPGERFNRAEVLLREVPRGLLLTLLSLIALGWLGYLVVLWRERRAPRVALLLLRLTSALALAWIVLGPSVELQRATRIPSRVAILVDASASMALGDGDASRMERARAAVETLRGALAGRFEVELHAFDSELRALAPDAVASLSASGTRSDIAAALAALAAGEPDRALGAVLLVSDGADNVRLAGPEDVLRRRAEWPAAPVFPVLAGDPARFRDLALVEPRWDRFGFARHELAIEARLVAHGFAGGKAEVVLREGERPIASRIVDLAGDDVSVPLAFSVKPDRPGWFLYQLEVRPQPGEAVVANNRLELASTVGRDQVRVLLICGRPSWDERFLRQMLKKDPSVDLVSFFILRDNEDQPGVPQDELSLIPFPYNDLFTSELENFDVVILQNFARTTFLTNLHLENLREWVVERGGGLLLVGGDLGMRAGGYAGTPLEGVLPFRLDVAGPDADEGAFSPLLTPAGGTHFVTNLEPEPEATRALFAALPPLDGSNRVGPLQDGGVALLVHPRLAAGTAPMPVLAVREAGRGRSMGLTVDSSWYWNFRAVARGGSNREYLRLWQNAVRWLAHDPSAKYLAVTALRETFAPGESAQLRVRALRSDYSPLAGGRVRVSVGPAADRDAKATVHEALTGEDGVLAIEVPATGDGYQRVEAELRDARGELVDRADTLYQVRADRTEVEAPGLGGELLDAIASATGGQRLGPEQLARPPIEAREQWRLAERRRVELWDNGFVYGALLLALATEWWLRRRAGFP